MPFECERRIWDVILEVLKVRGSSSGANLALISCGFQNQHQKGSACTLTDSVYSQINLSLSISTSTSCTKSMERRKLANSLDPKPDMDMGNYCYYSAVTVSLLVSSALRQLWLFHLAVGLHWCCFLSLCWFLLLRTGVPLVLSFLVLNSNVGGYAFS